MLRATAARNVKAALEAGTTFLADTTTAGLSWGPVAEAPMRAVVFAEVIGLRRDRGPHRTGQGLTPGQMLHDWPLVAMLCAHGLRYTTARRPPLG